MLSVADLFRAIRLRWKIEAAIFLAVMLIVGIWVFTVPKLYVASTTLLFDDAPISPVEGERSSKDNMVAQLSTQVEVIKSDRVAADVVKRLNLSSPQLEATWRESSGGNGDFDIWYGRILRAGLNVTSEKNSQVISINYRSRDPRFSAAIANGFAQAYLEQSLQLQTDPARTYSRWFEDRTKEVRGNLEKAQARLADFKRLTGIVDSGGADAESSRLNELQSAVTGAEVTSADLGARSQSSTSQSPDVQNSAVVQGLRAQIAAKSALLAQRSVALGPNHPERLAMEAELSTLRGKLDAETSAASTSVRVASRAAQAKESSLRGSLSSQKSRMLGLATDREQFAFLQQDVDSARTAYDLVTQKLESMRLQSVVPTTGVRNLDPAEVPLFPAEPNIGLLMLIGTALASMIAIGTAIALELWKPLARTDDGVEASTGLPVIANIDWSKSAVSSQFEQEGAT